MIKTGFSLNIISFLRMGLYKASKLPEKKKIKFSWYTYIKIFNVIDLFVR